MKQAMTQCAAVCGAAGWRLLCAAACLAACLWLAGSTPAAIELPGPVAGLSPTPQLSSSLTPVGTPLPVAFSPGVDLLAAESMVFTDENGRLRTVTQADLQAVLTQLAAIQVGPQADAPQTVVEMAFALPDGAVTVCLGDGVICQDGQYRAAYRTDGLLELLQAIGQQPVVHVPKPNTIESRIAPPEGYERLPAEGLQAYLRQLPLLKEGSLIHLHDGTAKELQSSHVAVLALDIINGDQQCADSIIRVLADYAYTAGDYAGIGFTFVDNIYYTYQDYCDGWRPVTQNGRTSLQQTGEPGDTRNGYRRYLAQVYAYANTYSLYHFDTQPIDPADLAIGDMFIEPGFPGHCVLVVDVAVNQAGEKVFLLAQGSSPAQQMHILKKPNSQSPWYSASDLKFPFTTREFTFYTASTLRRLIDRQPAENN